MPDTPPSLPSVTGDDLTEYRLQELEKVATGARQVERDVDTLKLVTANIENTLTEFKAEVRARDEHTQASLARLHERLDQSIQAQQERLNEISTGEAREEGRKAGAKDAQMRTGKVVAVTLTLVIAFGALVVGTLTLILN